MTCHSLPVEGGKGENPDINVVSGREKESLFNPVGTDPGGQSRTMRSIP